MIYLDNCSTTHHKPLSVKMAMLKGIGKYNYNAGRAGYGNAIKASMKVLELRQTACDFFGASDCSNVIITKSCTESLNIAIRSNPKINGNIVTTIFEHNSVLRTLEYMKQTYGISYTLLTPNKFGKITLDSVKNSIQSNTYMVIINHVSNVTGSIQDIEGIGKLCHDNKLIYVVDSAQSGGHKRINVNKCHINYLACAGHKGLLGPQGIGLLICNNAKPNPLLFGGTGTMSDKLQQPTDIPEGIESGTMSVANIMALTAGIKYVNQHLEKFEQHEKILTEYLWKEMNETKNVICYSPSDAVGVISFNINGKTSTEVSQILEQNKIECRSGLHCAPKVHEYYKTLKTGMCRIGLGYNTTLSQIKRLINVIKSIAEN